MEQNCCTIEYTVVSLKKSKLKVEKEIKTIGQKN
mgnify:CR=1 FL=1